MDEFKMETEVQSAPDSQSEQYHKQARDLHRSWFLCSMVCGLIALICGAVLIFMSFQVKDVLMDGIISQGQNSDAVLLYGIKVGALAAVLVLMITIQIILKIIMIGKKD